MTQTIDDYIHIDKKGRVKVKDIAKSFIVGKERMSEELFEYTWAIMNRNYNGLKRLEETHGPKKAIEMMGEYVAWRREQKSTTTSFREYLRKYYPSLK